MTLTQRRILARARLQASAIAAETDREAKGRAVHRLCLALRWLLSITRHGVPGARRGTPAGS